MLRAGIALWIVSSSGCLESAFSKYVCAYHISLEFGDMMIYDVRLGGLYRKRIAWREDEHSVL